MRVVAAATCRVVCEVDVINFKKLINFCEVILLLCPGLAGRDEPTELDSGCFLKTIPHSHMILSPCSQSVCEFGFHIVCANMLILKPNISH